MYIPHRKLSPFGFLQVEAAVDATWKDKPRRPCSGKSNLKVVVTMLEFVLSIRVTLLEPHAARTEGKF